MLTRPLVLSLPDKGLVEVGVQSTSPKLWAWTWLNDHDSRDEYANTSHIGGTGSDFFEARNMNVAFLNFVALKINLVLTVGRIISSAVECIKNELLMNSMCAINFTIANSLSSEVRVDRASYRWFGIPMNQKVMCWPKLEPDRIHYFDRTSATICWGLTIGAIVDAKTAEHAAGMTANADSHW